MSAFWSAGSYMLPKWTRKRFKIKEKRRKLIIIKKKCRSERAPWLPSYKHIHNDYSGRRLRTKFDKRQRRYRRDKIWMEKCHREGKTAGKGPTIHFAIKAGVLLPIGFECMSEKSTRFVIVRLQLPWCRQSTSSSFRCSIWSSFIRCRYR